MRRFTLLPALLLSACVGPGAKDAPDSQPDELTILAFTASPGTLEEGGEVVFSARVGHPQGPGAITGGALSDASGGEYGSFSAPSATGESVLSLSWSEINAVASIDFAVGAVEERSFHAAFSDTSGDTASASFTLGLACPNRAEGACGGACQALNRDDQNCGRCGNVCGEGARGCIDGACMFNSDCTGAVSESCTQICAEYGYLCRDTADFGVGFAYLSEDCTGTEGAGMLDCDATLAATFPAAQSGICLCAAP